MEAERFIPVAAGFQGLTMKAKTIKRYIIELNDIEAKLIYHALMQFENQNNMKNHGNINKIKELKECFYELLNPASVHMKNKSVF